VVTFDGVNQNCVTVLHTHMYTTIHRRYHDDRDDHGDNSNYNYDNNEKVPATLCNDNNDEGIDNSHGHDTFIVINKTD